jgi:hypothetical protein
MARIVIVLGLVPRRNERRFLGRCGVTRPSGPAEGIGQHVDIDQVRGGQDHHPQHAGDLRQRVIVIIGVFHSRRGLIRHRGAFF